MEAASSGLAAQTAAGYSAHPLLPAATFLPSLTVTDIFLLATDSPWLMPMRCLKTATTYPICNVHHILDKLWDVADSETWQNLVSSTAAVM